MIWEGPDTSESEAEESDFMRASKRNLAAILPPKLPGEEKIGEVAG